MTIDHLSCLSYGIYLNRQKCFADIKPVTVTADSPDLSNSVTELAYSMLKLFTPHMGITIEEGYSCIYQWIYDTRCHDLYVINVK